MKKISRIIFLLLALASLLFACKKEEVKSSTSGPVLSNNIFKVDVPKEFDGTYDTKVSDVAINFYDKECVSQGNPGWVFGLYAYQNPSEWAGGPIEKVGELTLNDGKLYDVVIAYPTESQFGFDREMPELYKNFYDARYSIASNVSGLNGEKVVVGAGAKGENIYNDILNKHLTAIKENWDSEKLENENMSTMYAIVDVTEQGKLDKVAYTYKDINLDGIEELLIGEMAEGDWANVIYDIYTMVDRKPTHVVSGWDRNRYFALDGGLIKNEYSGGAGESGVDIYALTTNSTELVPQLSYKYDSYENEAKPWFIAHNKTGDDWNYENVEESDYNELDNRFSNVLKLDYTAFSNIK